MTTPTATVTYLQADNIDIKFDLYVPPNVEGTLPAVVYFHGGGLVTGSRSDKLFLSDCLSDILKQHVMFISADYRLLIPTTGFAQIEDVKALFAVLSDASALKPHLPPNTTLDLSRIAVCGVSAGGYLARLAALYATPKPVAVWSLYGVGGDFLSDHWVDVHPAGFTFMPGPPTTREDVAHLVDATPPVEADVPLTFGPGGMGDKSNRFKLTNWLYITGEYLDKIAGVAGLGATLRAVPYAERVQALPRDVFPVFPQLHLAKDFPPTLLTHGAADSLVPVEESELSHQELQALGVHSQLTIVPNAEHGLRAPEIFPPQRAPGAQEAHDEGLQFMMKFLCA